MKELLVDSGRNEVVYKLPFADYQDVMAMNPSTLVCGAAPQSMLHLRQAWEYERDDTPAMLWGRAVHCLLLEPNEFSVRYVPWDGDRRGNAWKEFKARADAKGVEVLKSGDQQYSFDSAVAAGYRFVSLREIRPLIAKGQAEVSLFVVDHGVQCKGRIDWWSESATCILDVKTARAVDSWAFAKQFFQLHYDIKLGLYWRWTRQLTENDFPVKVAAVENKAPYDVVIYTVPEAVLVQGAAKGVALLEQLRGCIERDEWPGIAGGEELLLDVPAWEMADDDIEVEVG